MNIDPNSEHQRFDALQGHLMALEALMVETIKAIPQDQRRDLFQRAKILVQQLMAHSPENVSASQTIARVQRQVP